MEKIISIIQDCNGEPSKIANEMLALRFNADQLRQADLSGVIDDVANFVLGNIGNYSARDIFVFIYQGLFSEKQLFQFAGKGISPQKRESYRQIVASGWIPSLQSPEPPSTMFESPVHEAQPVDAPAPYGNPEPVDVPEQPAIDESKEFAAWQNTEKDNAKSLTLFLRRYPNGKYCEEARLCLSYMPVSLDDLLEVVKTQPIHIVLDTIRDFFEFGWVTKDEFLDVLREDHNLFTATTAYQLLTHELLSRNDFLDAGFDADVMDVIYNGIDSDDDFEPFNATELTREATEFYFWGVSGSGKSCALGAIMSAANSGEVAKAMIVDEDSDAASYLKYLRNVFTKGQLGVLPAGTPVGNFAAMGFTLVENGDPGSWLSRKINGVSKSGKEHPITCIDMAGGMLSLMSRRVEELSESEQEYIDNLNNLLCRSAEGNHAQHFFLVEYNDEDLSTQFDQLNRAIDQIQRLGLFKRKTDHIWLMITKCDRFKAQSEAEMVNSVKKYINDNCRPLYDKLAKICKDHNIDKGKPQVLPFWIGNVELQQYCKFDPARANKMVEIMLDTPYSSNIK